jgi:hypothetical protein
LLAALIILLLPGINKFRPFIIRDAGHLAAYLWSLVYLFRYCRTRGQFQSSLSGVRSLLPWAVLTCVAALFRIEVIVFLALVPLILIYQHYSGSRIRFSIVALGLLLIAMLSAGLALWIFGSDADTSARDLVDAPLQSITAVWAELQQQTSFRLRVIEQEFLNEFSREYSVTVMVITLLVIVIFESLRRLAFVYAFMAWFAVKKGLFFSDKLSRDIWLTLIICHISILCVFTLATFFLDSRYTMALVLTVLIPVPFAAARVLAAWLQPNRKSRDAWGFPLLASFVLLLGIDGLDVRTDKRYIQEAGYWLQTHTENEDSVYSNNHIVIHYAGRDALRSGWKYDWQETMSLTWGPGWRAHDFLALEFDHEKLDRKQRIINQIDLQPEIVFSNEKGDNVSIFRIPPE